MPIAFDYQADAAPIGEAALEAGQAISQLERDENLEQVRQFNQQFAERQRQFDLGLDQRAQQAALEGQLGYNKLAESGYRYEQGLAARAQENALQRQESQAFRSNQNQREQQKIAAQHVRDRQNKEFELAMADRQSGEEFQGWRDQDQQDEWIRNWEQTYGMKWNAPVQMAQQEQEDAFEEELLGSARAAATDENGVQLMSDEELRGMRTIDKNGMPAIDYPTIIKRLDRIRKDQQFAQTTQEKADKLEFDREKERNAVAAKEAMAEASAETAERTTTDKLQKREAEMDLKSDVAKHKYAEAKKKHTVAMRDYREKLVGQELLEQLTKDPAYEGPGVGAAPLEPIPPSIAAQGFPSINERIDFQDANYGLAPSGEFVMLKEGAIFRDLNNNYYIKKNGVPVRIAE